MHLYRPVGPKEYQLIEDSGFKRFPPRLPEQPIFYPVLNLEYARKIASEWNVPHSGVGFVMAFEIDDFYINRYEVQTVGSSVHQEYWIPAEDLEQFNDHIIGVIEAVEKYTSGEAHD